MSLATSPTSSGRSTNSNIASDESPAELYTSGYIAELHSTHILSRQGCKYHLFTVTFSAIIMQVCEWEGGGWQLQQLTKDNFGTNIDVCSAVWRQLLFIQVCAICAAQICHRDLPALCITALHGVPTWTMAYQGTQQPVIVLQRPDNACLLVPF